MIDWQNGSFVIGSSPALLNLSQEVRARLDAAPFVMALNLFPAYWRLAGFRPSAWVLGDIEHCGEDATVRDVFGRVALDSELHARMKTLFVGVPLSAQMSEKAAVAGLRVFVYRRHRADDRDQRPAQDRETDPIYHYGSSLTDAVNLARLMNPGEPIYLYGNEPGGGEHFYAVGNDPAKVDGHCKMLMWQGLARLRRYFFYPIIDCNRHTQPVPADWPFPRESFDE
jgi:hypothetical protein